MRAMPPSRRSAAAAAAVALMAVRERVPDTPTNGAGASPAVSPHNEASATPTSADCTTDLPMSQSFDTMLGRLKTFYAENGRGAVPPPTSSLGVWTASQRLEKRHNLLPPAKEAALTSAGLEWAPHWSGVTWGQRYAELVDFYQSHGHCRVRYSGGGLGGWVSTQRRAKKAGRLSEERTKKLEDIGFIWDARPDGDGRGMVTRPADGTPTAAAAAAASTPTAAPPQAAAKAAALSSSPRAAPWAGNSGPVSALTRAVNRAVEEREAEQAARAAAAAAAAAAAGGIPHDSNRTNSPANTALSGPSENNLYSSPPTLPAKKRLRASGFHYSGDSSINDANNGMARSPSPPAAAAPPAASAAAPSWYGSNTPAPGVTSIVTAAPQRLGDDTAPKRTRRQKLPGVGDRVRALVGEIVAENLAPPRSETAPPPPPDSSVRRWARATYVGVSDETLNRVVADGTRQL